MERAKEILGVDHEWLGFVDSGLPEGDPLPPLPAGSFAATPIEEAVRPLVEAVRRLRPHVMTTYDENGGYPPPRPHPGQLHQRGRLRPRRGS